MTIEEMTAVMLAYAGGAKVDARSRGVTSGWQRSPTPCWDWNNYEYRISQPSPKKVFGPEDFVLGKTEIKHPTDAKYVHGLVIGLSSVGLSYGGGEGGMLSFEDINTGHHGHLYYSNDGEIWRSLKP